MKALQMGLWSIWLSGFLLIALSLFATQKLPPLHNNSLLTKEVVLKADSGNFKITIFSAPRPFEGTVGLRQSEVILSWLGLSPDITVVLFSQDPFVLSFADNFGSRVLVESHIDFTFLGTPFFHSMIARSQNFPTEISVFVGCETVLLPNFIYTMDYARKLDQAWLLVASSRNVSDFPFYLDDAGKYWLRKDGKMMTTHELQDVFGQSWQQDCLKETLILAWNHVDLPLHNGVIPPFLYDKGIHNQWVISEAVSSGLRFVFDASCTMTSFSLQDPENSSDQSSNFKLGALYGTSYFQDVNLSSIVKLIKCGHQYQFVNTSEPIIDACMYQRPSLWKRKNMLSQKKKTKTCDNVSVSQWRTSMKTELDPSVQLPFSFSMESLLSIMADDNKTIVLSVAGYSYKDMLMNWVCRLRQLLITNFIVCALDRETYEFAILQGIPVFADPLAPSNISFDDCHFGTNCFQRVTKVKSRIVLKILKLGYNVLLSDVDVYWFKNPLPLLSSFGPSVLAAQSDEYNESGPINLPRRLNSGFYFARSDGPTISAMEKVVKHAENSGLSEQPSFYDTLCGENGSYRVNYNTCIEPHTNLTIHFLNRDLFPNGAYLGLWEKKNTKAVCLKKGCLVLHNNWINGRLKKLERQVSSGLWEYDSGTRMCLQSWHK
ncbi:hypothetical protein ACFE04_022036 [Oxalis oulophora]